LTSADVCESFDTRIEQALGASWPRRTIFQPAAGPKLYARKHLVVGSPNQPKNCRVESVSDDGERSGFLGKAGCAVPLLSPVSRHDRCARSCNCAIFWAIRTRKGPAEVAAHRAL